MAKKRDVGAALADALLDASKGKAKAVQPVSLELMVDRLGGLLKQVETLDTEIANAAPEDLRKRRGALAKDAAVLQNEVRQAMAVDLAVEGERETIGHLYVARLGKQRENREIKNQLTAFEALTHAKRIGKDKQLAFLVTAEAMGAFLEACSIPLGALDKYLSGVEREKLVEKKAGGDATRQLKITSRV